VKEFWGFLGLTGYYHKFIQNYGSISKPLTDLLKKNKFTWNDTCTQAFKTLKMIMSSAPVLAMPNFALPFIIETDASDKGLGAVLMREKCPITYLSKALGVKH
jgi:uncharacterized protein (UPF0216 family)